MSHETFRKGSLTNCTGPKSMSRHDSLKTAGGEWGCQASLEQTAWLAQFEGLH